MLSPGLCCTVGEAPVCQAGAVDKAELECYNKPQ